MSRLTRDGTARPSREIKFSGANADREIFVFPVQLTTYRISNLIRLIHSLAICDDHTRLALQSVGPQSYPVMYAAVAKMGTLSVEKEVI